MDSPAWSTQQLAEFVASVSACTTEAAVARAATERAAEALDADVAAIMCGDELLAAVGYPEHAAPVKELAGIRPGVADSWLNVPGAGRCAAAAAALAYPPGTTLILARPSGLTRQETSLLRGMARVTEMTMRMLRVLDHERAAREEVERLAQEQVALRRVATLVARGALPREVFAAVAQEAGHVLPNADFATIGRYDPGNVVEVVGGWSRAGSHRLVGRRWKLGGQNVNTLVFERNQPARVDYRLTDGADEVTAAAREFGMRSSVGAPISVDGRPWGVMGVASTREHALPPGTEHRLAEFTDLLATAIANAEAQAQLTISRARIVATADETRRRIERDLHDGAQQRLVTLTLQLRAAQAEVPPQLGQLTADLGQVVAGLTDTLDELREYARGIHPAILAKGGLESALKMLARGSPIPVTLKIRIDRRLPEQIEVTAYYVISEALANAAKHAEASSIMVAVETTAGLLRLDVRDNGVGGADPARGSGLIGLQDRVEAIGGTFTVKSRPGEGTRLLSELPVRLPQPPSD